MSGAAAAFHRAAGEIVDGSLGRFRGDVNVLFLAPEVKAAEATKGANLEDVDLGGLLGLVGGEGGVGGGATSMVKRLWPGRIMLPCRVRLMSIVWWSSIWRMVLLL